MINFPSPNPKTKGAWNDETKKVATARKNLFNIEKELRMIHQLMANHPRNYPTIDDAIRKAEQLFKRPISQEVHDILG